MKICSFLIRQALAAGDYAAAVDALLDHFGEPPRHSQFKITAWDRGPIIRHLSMRIRFSDGRTMRWHEETGASQDMSWEDARSGSPGMLGMITIIK